MNYEEVMKQMNEAIKGKTYIQLCQTIAKSWNDRQSEKVYEPEEIFNYSPTGELMNIPFWYMDAKAYLESKGMDL